MAPTPSVRVVVVNHNAGAHLDRCLRHLAATQWPADALEVVVVDNASTDASADGVEARHPGVRVVRSAHNLGFAGGNNLAFHDLDGPGGADLVALVNPDAFVEPGWLAPLVEAVTAEADVGAANPKLLLAPRFVRVDLSTKPFVPGGHDPRTLGVRVLRVQRHGADCWDATVFGDGCYDLEATAGERFRWTAPQGTLFLPLPDDLDDPDDLDGPAGPDGVGLAQFTLSLAGEAEKPVRLVVEGSTTETTAAPGGTTVDLDVTGAAPVDVVNSAGNDLVEGAFGADRGFGEPDDGRFDEAVEVFAWTGAAVLLDAAYLRDVGLFDPTYFMYSEDLDLSWRGRLRGWRYRYVPESRVRHVRGASAGHRTAAADVHSHRNALVTLVKNAPAGVARREVRRYLSHLGEFTRFEVVQPLRRRERPQPVFAGRRARVMAGFAARLPRALWQRRRIGRRATVSRTEAIAPWT